METQKLHLIKGTVIFGYPASGLRTEARKGRLDLIRVAGKDYVTAEAIREMERKCRVTPKEPTSDSRSEPTDRHPPGSSSTADASAALASAVTALKKLKKRLPTILQPDSSSAGRQAK